ncbi:MAG: hypothetical protein IPK08_19345 [Bacteroidetes bacterium]|nr:hypothetical protein [Bacteroidota bacterium]
MKDECKMLLRTLVSDITTKMSSSATPIAVKTISELNPSTMEMILGVTQ